MEVLQYIENSHRNIRKLGRQTKKRLSKYDSAVHLIGQNTPTVDLIHEIFGGVQYVLCMTW